MAKRKKRVEREAEVITPVDFREVLPVILARVAGVNDLESWKAAFPKIEFMEVDEGFSGKRINWEARSAVEIAVYVAFMNDPQMASVDCSIDADGYKVDVPIRDSERLWWLWLAGAFSFFDEERELSLNAKETLLRYAAQGAGDFEDMVIDRVWAGDVSLLSLKLEVKPPTFSP